MTGLSPTSKNVAALFMRREEKLSGEQKDCLGRLSDSDAALADARRLTQEFARMLALLDGEESERGGQRARRGGEGQSQREGRFDQRAGDGGAQGEARQVVAHGDRQHPAQPSPYALQCRRSPQAR